MERLNVLLAALLIAGCTPDAGSSGHEDVHWTRVSGLSGGGETHFVVVDPANLQNASAYKLATKSLCSKSNLCDIAFFRSQTEAPINQTSAQFFNAGGYKNYRAIAVYHKNANTGLDRVLFNCNFFTGYGASECMASGRKL